MADTVIFPLSEETGREILAALLRIAKALEGDSGGITASVNGTDITIEGDGATVDGTDLSLDDPDVTVDGTNLDIP